MMFLSLSLRRKGKGDCMAKAVLIMDMPECCADPDEKCGAWTDGMIAAYNKYLSEVLERKE